jgi:hypothetical protein
MFSAETARRGLDAVLVPLEVSTAGLPTAFTAMAGARNV